MDKEMEKRIKEQLLFVERFREQPIKSKFEEGGRKMTTTKKSKIQIRFPSWFAFLAYILNQLTGLCIATIGFTLIVFIIKNFEKVLRYQWKDLVFLFIGFSIWMLVVGIAIIWKTNNSFIIIWKESRR